MSTHDPYETPRPYPPQPSATPSPQPDVDAVDETPTEGYSAPPPTADPWSGAGAGSTEASWTPTAGYGEPGQGRFGPPSGYPGPAPAGAWLPSPYGAQPYGAQPHGAQPYGAQPYGAPYGPPAPAAPPRSRGLLAGLAALVVAAALVLIGVGFAAGRTGTTSGNGSALQLPQVQGPGTDPSGGALPGGAGNGGALPGGGSTSGGSKTPATATQQIGVVTIVSVLKYQNAESAGTGMILTADGRVLTNNHVVNGATSITVTVESTGRSYRASVVGTAPTKDVAVLQLADASGLQTAKLASTSQDVKVGDAVVGVGNAGGTGSLTAASGKVTALNQTITATDESGAEAERLTDLIEIDAPIISGDSGGPLYDAKGEVIGIDTAASTNRTGTATGTAYAIRIDTALDIARQIESGVQTTTIHIGLPAFVGFSLADQGGRVVVPQPRAAGGSTIVPGGPADKAGITPGATITSIGGTAVSSAAQIKSILATKNPGDRITIGWTDPAGSPHTATVTLTTGPAD